MKKSILFTLALLLAMTATAQMKFTVKVTTHPNAKEVRMIITEANASENTYKVPMHPKSPST